MTRVVSEKRVKTPWINKRILKCIDKKHDWYKLVKRGLICNNSYKKYCYALRELLRMAKEDYYKSKLSSLSGDQKANWNIINNLVGKESSAVSVFF